MESIIGLEGGFYWIVFFLIGIVTGAVGAMGGSAGLIITPFMMLTGMPPALAIGTARLSAFGGWAISIKKFNQGNKVHWKKLPPIAAIATIAGALGTFFVIQIDRDDVYVIVGSLMMIISPLVFFQKNFGLEDKKYSSRRELLGYAVYFFVMIYGGFFGGGAGIMAIFTLVVFMGYQVLDAHATHTTAWMIMSLVSTSIFIFYGQVDYLLALILFIGMTIGGYIGAHIALK